ncbi:hypothetical protein BBK36DRAFT_1200739 [Trichoderma citrinoviride]|uniref:Erythromycin esterase n=1 Tax=Trichoderma citrinoviride TaxID=58853 RepID=A0A2T4BAI8_9HYPO|nr:hypothetical protein BBK36DRAFT_1200739 [Trichoderma citrinoviride]PTB66326.1 hypothetical protein BBK36DRAFT_1200739 [Trichoderma citrinoviride]
MSAPPRRSARLAKVKPELLVEEDSLNVVQHVEPERKKRNKHVEPELPEAAGRVEPASGSRTTPKKLSDFAPPATPATHAMKPPSTEMHPSKFHPTTAEPSSALRLGFTDIDVAKRRDSSHGAGLQSTPSKVGGVPSSAFTLRVPHGIDANQLGLGPEALRVLEGLKEKAAEYKADLIAQRANDPSSAATDANGRTIAKPKGKSGRFSAAHMAEFKKMDSIEGHASAWRAQNGRFSPVKSGVKRSHSKTNLDTPQKNAKPSPSKLQKEAPSTVPRKRASEADSFGRFSARRAAAKASVQEPQSPAKDEQPSLPAKRLKKTADDDASTARPAAQESTSIPRPMPSPKRPTASRIGRPSISRLVSPRKSVFDFLASPGKPKASGTAAPPSKSVSKDQGETKEPKEPKESVRVVKDSNEPKGLKELKASIRAVKDLTEFKGLKEAKELKETKELKEAKLQEAKEPEETDNVDAGLSNSAMKRSLMRSVFGGSPFSPKAKSAIPQPVPTTAQTPPAPTRFSNLNITRLAATQPVRKLAKHVTFTPEVTRTVFDPDTPSPLKSTTTKRALVYSPAEEVLAASKSSGDITYPDLSSYKHLLESKPESVESPTPSVPGKFTFRSDHTIKFGNPSPSGFGASPGQSSVRHVRNSIKPASEMPGAFPDPVSPSSHPNKENTAPSPPKMLPGVPHGMANKKRHRAGTDEGDADKEAADRAGKKAKSSHVPEGEALLAPRLLATTPSATTKKPSVIRTVGQTPGARPINRKVSSASPSKKRPTLSMSRLNMLARPKNRG